ncbi:hypothetical protein Y046_4770 [Burkholderia pseudomallei MSHR2990]|uniref:hypothetical protein n=1 Tax=Burkholderia pseudomallei TaxID=28450 RepID=UPI000537CA6C|nr:hypothetical protein [Burkholderia pseudomallei]KGW78524.1 hypothetical protein Y046_4770 [Burkholderia pseudomallei MSHR2990]
MRKFAVAMLLTAPSIAFAAVYSVTEHSGVTTGAELTALGQSVCVYADVPIALGDILSYPDRTRQVCASGVHGAQLIDVMPTKQ